MSRANLSGKSAGGFTIRIFTRWCFGRSEEFEIAARVAVRIRFTKESSGLPRLILAFEDEIGDRHQCTAVF